MLPKHKMETWASLRQDVSLEVTSTSKRPEW